MKNRFLFLLVVLIAGCQTKNDLKREQELERLKSDVSYARGTKADLEQVSEEMRTDMQRLKQQVEDLSQNQHTLEEQYKNEVKNLTQRITVLEQKQEAVEAHEQAQVQAQTTRVNKASFEYGKKFYDEGDFGEALEVWKEFKKKAKGEDLKKTRFYIGEAYFGEKEYATAALEYSEFKKHYPKDALASLATLKQGMAFKNLQKSKEAKLFFQEVVDKYPKSPSAQKAKAELKKMK